MINSNLDVFGWQINPDFIFNSTLTFFTLHTSILSLAYAFHHAYSNVGKNTVLFDGLVHFTQSVTGVRPWPWLAAPIQVLMFFVRRVWEALLLIGVFLKTVARFAFWCKTQHLIRCSKINDTLKDEEVKYPWQVFLLVESQWTLLIKRSEICNKGVHLKLSISPSCLISLCALTHNTYINIFN